MPGLKKMFQERLLSILTVLMAWLFLAILPANAEIAPRPGWVITPTPHAYLALTQRVIDAAKRQKIGVITVASATIGAQRAFNKEIPGNMVMGLFHPRFAVRTLAASVEAGIEAPIRVYVTENPDGTATVSYKMPSFVFAPYYKTADADLKAVAQELDTLFNALVK
ncbi:MAG: DUF302 domain-containing protein, partial [Aestuariivirgaceae bacterium]